MRNLPPENYIWTLDFLKITCWPTKIIRISHHIHCGLADVQHPTTWENVSLIHPVPKTPPSVLWKEVISHNPTSRNSWHIIEFSRNDHLKSTQPIESLRSWDPQDISVSLPSLLSAECIFTITTYFLASLIVPHWMYNFHFSLL